MIGHGSEWETEDLRDQRRRKATWMAQGQLRRGGSVFSSPIIVNVHIYESVALWTVIYMLIKASLSKASALQQLCPCWALTRADPV